MSVTSFEATVKDGQILLPDNVQLRDNTKVYVVILETGNETVLRMRGPRLVDSKHAAAFQKQVLPEDSDAGV